MIILVGASASGKTEVAKILASKYNIKKIITHTTRNMREGEQNDVDYHFVSKDQFEELLKQDYFVEHTLYNGNYYGTSKKEVQDDKCLIVDTNGLKAFKALNDNHIVVFKLIAEEKTRFDRMIGRGDSKENAETRIINDRIKFSDEEIGKVDYTINTEALGIEGVADLVSKTYKEKIKLK
ncbi:MAG: guanylate kinase [Bacilli bacterium]|nr:guanylate kinase [Bacilli bacterium]